MNPSTPTLRILLAEPRGFCAGVDRAVSIVLRALEKFGAPLYVRHEIVHNRTVVDTLKAKGAVFVEELDQVPDGATVIFSAHGVSKAVEAEASRRPLKVLDATCPLVSKVHREAERLEEEGYRTILIGHQGHPEVVGTMGQLPDGAIEVVSKVDEIADLPGDPQAPAAYITQTTLSVDETVDVVQALNARFPGIKGPDRDDICYATQSRQNAVKALADKSDLVLVLGAPNSSNSNRLREVAERAGCPAKLIESAADVEEAWLDGVKTLGITAGASAPETLVSELLEALKPMIHEVDLLSVGVENIAFQLPRELQD